MGRPYYFGMTVDDVALDGWSTPEHFAHLVDFFVAEHVKATFFVVPIDEATDKPFYTLSDKYAPIIKNGHSAGHCFGQHGLRHNRFELGIPPMIVLDLPHEVENKKYALENKAALEKEHSVANCRARLRQGRKVLEDALEMPFRGFRAPALQESPGMFQALIEEGYAFDSSCLLQETMYDYYMDRMDATPRDITRERWEKLRAKCPIMLPLTCDYTWFLAKEKYEQTMALAKHDFMQALQADIPFVTVCHVDPVHNGEGIRFLKEYYAFAREAASNAGRDIQFETLERIAEEINKGAAK